ncbi:hypothetical protein E6C27_scaffold269G00110 [Cucumis melo var. makuwa]|uniref:Ty3-gypsy retrotransposon protein n=1 Tax=Cucumis melo var. makuwa TaxID=1194695 RepID=A0A5A7SQW8_CUCMM|nr:hypothetical protein E6C27_scaffold269G00110 [Cucumis melo var. makuwa]
MVYCNAPKIRGIKELTFKFSGFAEGLVGDSFLLLGVDSIEGHNQVPGKGSPTIGPQSEAGNVVVHRGLHAPMLDVRYSVVMLTGYVVDWNCMSMDLEVTVTHGLVWTEGLICASFGSTRLMCASFGSTRLICASSGSTRLICAFYGTTRLLSKGTARGRPTRGRKDA